MLNVSYKNRMGYCMVKDENQKPKWKVWFCHANALCAMMYFYKDENKVNMVQLHAFFVDNDHAKKCIENKFFDDRYCNFHFYAKEMDDGMWRMVKAMTKHGIKVTIE